jgi:Uma2 family endonuclease
MAMRAFHHQYTFEQYLRIDGDSNIKLEFLNGEIFAMSGGTPEHSALAAALVYALSRQLEGRPCRVYNSHLRVGAPASGLYTYPDVTVVCGQPEYEPRDKNTIVNPVVVIEVLSDSTEAYDRRDKFEHYRLIPALQEYVLASHREALIEVYRRVQGNEWRRTEGATGSSARLESIGCVLDVNKIYAGIELHRSG